VAFIDADQIVRTDIQELFDLDLEGAPYGYTPFCSDRKEMDGFRYQCKGNVPNAKFRFTNRKTSFKVLPKFITVKFLWFVVHLFYLESFSQVFLLHVWQTDLSAEIDNYLTLT